MSLISRAVHLASQAFPKLSSRVLASSGYTLDVDRLEPAGGFGVWDPRTAKRQDDAWQPLVAKAKAGHPRDDIRAMWDAVAAAGPVDDLLEVGCGGGYNSELLLHRFPDLAYTGVDIAPAMVEISRATYPGRRFQVGSAYDLEFDDDAFDVVLDGVALLHMAEWPRAISEYVRVSRGVVILHGLTLTEAAPTTRFAKYAYGQPAVELVMNRDEVLSVCTAAGLRLETSFPNLDYDLADVLGIPSVSETWLLRR